MKRIKLVLLAMVLGGAVLAASSLQPMAQSQDASRESRRVAINLDGLEVRIIPASSEAARISPALLAELQAAGEPFHD